MAFGEKSGRRQTHVSRGGIGTNQSSLRTDNLTSATRCTDLATTGITGVKPEVGSEFMTSRGSEASSAPTFTNLPVSILLQILLSCVRC